MGNVPLRAVGIPLLASQVQFTPKTREKSL